MGSPFGLAIRQNSYWRERSIQQNYKYNGIELQQDLGWNNYLAEFRSYDPTIGRWRQIDPKASGRESPYVGMGNNPPGRRIQNKKRK
ncbi:RHS repeat-associated core domain-containing protein [Agaribacillus aureus]|uniref:RHS repeat-associated core domain-containing protein n=1 Tax=Agaribacillus aureus TaxID=3051825 RepID=UPI003D20A08F